MTDIRVVLADDHTMIRSGLHTLLDAEDGFTVVAEAADGDQAVRAAREHRPDVVVMDLRMPGVDGLEATRRIAGDPELAGVRVLVLTTFDEDELVFAAIRAGAAGFLLKDAEPAELLSGLRTVAAGEALLAPRVTRRLIETFLAAPGVAAPGVAAPERGQLALLTPRERDIVALVGRGLSNREIAEQVVISPATARTHVSRAMVKIGARDRAQLVVFAYEAGLVVPGGPR